MLLITSLLLINYYFDFSEDIILDTTSAEVVRLQREIDSLALTEIEARKPKRYPFNPNFITDFKAYTLGISSEEFDRLQQFRSKDQWINSVADFKRVTKVSDSLLAVISPYFKFPDWVNNRNLKQSFKKNSTSEKTYDQKIDLNKATALQLQEVYGIGEVFSRRIISYRGKLGGFSSDIQLQNVWGLDEIVINSILKSFTVKTPKAITKMNINTASASDLSTIPGISFDLAKEIWEFRRLRDTIRNLSELEKIQGLSSGKLSLIQLYLSLE